MTIRQQRRGGNKKYSGGGNSLPFNRMSGKVPNRCRRANGIFISGRTGGGMLRSGQTGVADAGNNKTRIGERRSRRRAGAHSRCAERRRQVATGTAAALARTWSVKQPGGGEPAACAAAGACAPARAARGGAFRRRLRSAAASLACTDREDRRAKARVHRGAPCPSARRTGKNYFPRARCWPRPIFFASAERVAA
jgi:hypothetical protein